MAKPQVVPPLLPPAPYTRPSMTEPAQRGPLRPGEYDIRPRIGLSVMPLETRREAIIALATEGDRLGYDGFFMPETWGYDMTVLLAEAAARTTRITLGTGIVGIWNRSAATIAMAAATAPRSSRKACTTHRSSRRCRACAGWSRRSVRCSAASASHSR